MSESAPLCLACDVHIDGDYENAIQCVVADYSPGLILTFATARTSTSTDVLIASSFIPSTPHMPLPEFSLVSRFAQIRNYQSSMETTTNKLIDAWL